MSYEFGHLEPWWNEDFKNLNYIYYPLKNTHDEKRWIEELNAKYPVKINEAVLKEIIRMKD